MKNTPLISVIMPCFNAQTFVKTAIDSVFNQTYTNVELIIVDDGSSDNSYDVVMKAGIKHPSLKALKQQVNQGPYPARNLALAHAKGEYIAFLDADDYWAEDCLEKLLTAIREAEADLSYCGWQNVVVNGNDFPPYIPPAYEAGDIFEHFLTNCPWPIHAALVKRAIVDQVHGFSVTRFSSMDYDFWLRVSALTQKMTQVKEVLAFYRWHEKGQISSIKWRQILDAWQVKKNFVINYPILVAHIPAIKKREMIDGFVVKQAYAAFWRRDLVSAQYLFRNILLKRIFRPNDLPYILLSFLPYYFYAKFVMFFGNGTLK